MGGRDYPDIPTHVTPAVFAIKRQAFQRSAQAWSQGKRIWVLLKIRRIHINAADLWRVARLLHDIRIGRTIRAINAAIPGEAIRPSSHAAATNEPAGALLASHAGQLPFAGLGALRRFLRRQRQGEQQKTSQENFAHGLASPVKDNALLTRGR
jgi:hypothetical protein